MVMDPEPIILASSQRAPVGSEALFPPADSLIAIVVEMEG